MNFFRSIIRGKTRIVIYWLFAIGLILAAIRMPFPGLPWWIGLALAFVGASLRFWASGYLRKDNSLAIGGPYRLVRNPLYLGSYLVGVGAALALENWILFAAVTVVFAAIYHFIILDEENKLTTIFGPTYMKYCQTVPRFFPRLWPPLLAPKKQLQEINPDPVQFFFSWKIAMKNRAYEAYAAFLALFVVMGVMGFLFSPLVQEGYAQLLKTL